MGTDRTVPCGAGKGKGKCSQSEAEAWEGYCESDDKRPFVIIGLPERTTPC